MHECRYDERLKTKVEKSTRLVYTGLIGELEHLKLLFIKKGEGQGRNVTLETMMHSESVKF
jgi:hypothetical protein